MPTQQNLPRPLIVMVVIAFAISTVTATGAGKKHTCCTSVSRNVTIDPIIGYTLQYPDPPCVKAVIFKTDRGKYCNWWKKSSVWKKICNFETNGTSNCTQARSWARKKFPKFLYKKK